MNEKLSVIVPIYNVECYLRQCIESIINQSYKNLEIILVDDGSTDSSGYICDEYGKCDDRIRVIHKQNEGLINARCTGVEYAISSYITFVDGDDWILSNMYDELMFILLNENVDLVTSGCIRYYDDLDCFKTVDENIKEGRYDKGMIEKEIIPKMIWCPETNWCALDSSLCIKIFKKEYLLGQYKELKNHNFYYAEDYATIYPIILMLDSLYVTYKSYYYHRQKKRGTYVARLADDNYFDGLYDLYTYLRNIFNRTQYKDTLMKQLDYFYIKSAGYRSKKYKEYDYTENNYLFPFDKIQKGNKIVLYGAGPVGRTYYKQIKKLCYVEIILWVDKNYKDLNNSMVESTDEIKKFDYDYIVIANRSLENSLRIKENLIGKGFQENKIII